MTKKRFTLRDPKIDVGIDCEEIADNGEWVTYGDIVDALNELFDENEQLRYKYNEKCNEYIGLEEQVDSLLKENEQLKDEHHTMQELYDFRLVYNALLFNEWSNREDIEVYKSKRHHDGSIPFNNPNWFIVVAILPTGKQITNHYHIKSWNYFHIKEYPKVKDEFDGHTSKEALDRLKEVIE